MFCRERKKDDRVIRFGEDMKYPDWVYPKISICNRFV